MAVSLLTLTIVAPAPAAMASGTAGGDTGGVPTYFPSKPRDPVAEAYARGKWLVSRRISCKKCEFNTGVKDTATAQKVATRVRAGEFEIKPDDREQVLFYLSRRFGA